MDLWHKLVPEGFPAPPQQLVPNDQRNFKASHCSFFTGGSAKCRNGHRCRFAHGLPEIRPEGMGPTPEEADRLGLPMSPQLRLWWAETRATFNPYAAPQAPRPPPMQPAQRPPPPPPSQYQQQQQGYQAQQPAADGGSDDETDPEVRELRRQFPEEYAAMKAQERQHRAAQRAAAQAAAHVQPQVQPAQRVATVQPAMPQPQQFPRQMPVPVVHQQPAPMQVPVMVPQQGTHLQVPIVPQQPVMVVPQVLSPSQPARAPVTIYSVPQEFNVLSRVVRTLIEDLTDFARLNVSVDQHHAMWQNMENLRVEYQAVYKRLGVHLQSLKEQYNLVKAQGHAEATLEPLRLHRDEMQARTEEARPLVKEMGKLADKCKAIMEKALAAVPGPVPQSMPAPTPVPVVPTMAPVPIVPSVAAAPLPVPVMPQMVTPMQVPVQPTVVRPVTVPVQPAVVQPVTAAVPVAAATPAAPKLQVASNRATTVPAAAAAAAAPVASPAPAPAAAGTKGTAAPAQSAKVSQKEAKAAQPAPDKKATAAAAPETKPGGKAAPTPETKPAAKAPETKPATKAPETKPATAKGGKAPAHAAPEPQATAAKAAATAKAAAATATTAKATESSGATTTTPAASTGARAAQVEAITPQQTTPVSQQQTATTPATPAPAGTPELVSTGVTEGAVIISTTTPAKTELVTPIEPPEEYAVPEGGWPHKVQKTAETSASLMQQVQVIAEALLPAVIISEGPVAELEKAVNKITSKPNYHAIQCALLLVQCMSTTNMPIPSKDVRAAIVVQQLSNLKPEMDLKIPRWRETPSTVDEYLLVLVWEVVGADQAVLLERMDEYMVNNKATHRVTGQPVTLPSGSWRTWRRKELGSMVQHMLKKNAVKVLKWGISNYGFDQMFELHKGEWQAVTNSADASSGMYVWAHKLGAGLNALELMLKPWCTKQEQLWAQQRQSEGAQAKLRPSQVKEQVALITSFVLDGVPAQLAGMALAASELSVQWKPSSKDNEGPWLLPDGKAGSFLHFVLYQSPGQSCPSYVQVSVSRLMEEHKLAKTPVEAMEIWRSLHVRQKDPRNTIPLMIAVERSARSKEFAEHLPEVLEELLTLGADPLDEHLKVRVETTPMHTLINKIHANQVPPEAGAKALAIMAKYARGDDQPSNINNTVVTTKERMELNVLAAAIDSGASYTSALVEALCKARTDLNPVQLLMLDPNHSPNYLQTPLSMALTSKQPRPARPEMAKVLISNWKPEMLLYAMHSQLPPEHRQEVRKFLIETKDITLSKLADLGEADLKPLLDAALEEQGTMILELLLKHAPKARFESIDLVHREVPLDCLDELVNRGAHARLVGRNQTLPDDAEARHKAKVAFLQQHIDGELAKFVLPTTKHSGSLPYDKIDPNKRFNPSNTVILTRERIAFRLVRLLKVLDHEGKGPLYEAFLPDCKFSGVHFFGQGIGSGKATQDLFRMLLEAGCIDPTERDPRRCGMTLLHLAVADLAGHAVKALIQAGGPDLVMARIEPRIEEDADSTLAKPKKPFENTPTLEAVHDNLNGFIPLHLAAKVMGDIALAQQQPLAEIPDVREVLIRTSAHIEADMELALRNLLDVRTTDQSQVRAPHNAKKGNTPRMVLGSLPQDYHIGLLKAYDAIYSTAGDKEKAQKAERLRREVEAVRHGKPIPDSTEAEGQNARASSSATVPAAVTREEQEHKAIELAIRAGPGENTRKIGTLIQDWSRVSEQKQDEYLDILVNVMVEESLKVQHTLGAAAATPGEDDVRVQQQACFSKINEIIQMAAPEDSQFWTPADDEPPDDENTLYSDDDVPDEVVISSTGARTNQSRDEVAQETITDPALVLNDLDWMFTITKEARQSWACLPPHARSLVMKRLREIGKGLWQRSGGVKRLPGDNDALRGLDLWRLKIDKAGRILFEVAVEFDETQNRYSECIRLWCITMSHKKYEDCILKVHESYRRSQQVRERKKLLPEFPDQGGGGGVHESVDGRRLPRTFKSTDNEGLAAMLPAGPTTVTGGNNAVVPADRTNQRDHLPPANYDPEQFTLLKMYNVDKVLLSTVMQGLTDAKVELPFKVSPKEWEFIMKVPKPPCSFILLGRSGTGKTTCAVYRMWAKWLEGYKQWIPGQQAMAAAGVQDAMLAAGNMDERAAQMAMDFAAKTIGGSTVFVTASATLKESVKRAFRKMQMAAMKPDEYARVLDAGRVQYLSFKNVEPDAFPMFLTSRQYLEMLDATLANPFFKRRADGSIVKAVDPNNLDMDSADLVINLEQDEEEGGDYDDDEGADLNNEEAEEAQDLANVDEPVAVAEEEQPLAGNVAVAKEVTWLYFKEHMWPKITTAEQRDQIPPALVWAEICSYIKGSVEAMESDDGHLSLEQYMTLGAKRAANFDMEERRDKVWPIFLKYQRERQLKRRYDMMDFVAHIFQELRRAGYQGRPISSVYRDEVQDFTQAELALDLNVVADPNNLFYCGDTAQTIARGVGFRFQDIKTLLHMEGQKRLALRQELKKAGQNQQVIQAGSPEILQLSTNYRTHQGILNTASVVIDLIKQFYPNSIDNLDREKALFPGPDPILLAGTESTDLTYLMFGSDRSTSQVEFGANQVILVRTMAARDKLPPEIRESAALIMTVPQAKGLEFDDVFLFNFFENSPADASEWRVLNHFVEETKKQVEESREGGKDLKVFKDNLEILERFKKSYPTAHNGFDKQEMGYIRPQAFDERKHVLLQEELKHLYTGITRAKSNVVFFDLNKEKRAPFYNLLRSFGMARVVNRSLLDDGADARTFGLSHTAQDSKAEWFKRAKSLMDKNSPGLAEKAFRQAGDNVRAEVAAARHIRAVAGGQDTQDDSGKRAPLSLAQKRRMLHQAAFRALLAVQHCPEAPVPVTGRELVRWVKLAARCLSEVKQMQAAAQLHALVYSYRDARAILQGIKNYKLEAEVCQKAAKHYQQLAAQSEAEAKYARSQLLVAGQNLAQMLSDADSAQARISRRADECQQQAESRQRLSQLYTARAALAYWRSEKENEACLRMLKKDGITESVRKAWPSVYKDLLIMSRLLMDVGKMDLVRQALELAPDSKEKEEQMKRFGMWSEVAAARLRAGDVAGVARVHIAQRQHKQAAQLLVDLLAARSARLQGTAAPTPVSAELYPTIPAVLQSVADMPVASETVTMLRTCVLALPTSGDLTSLQLQQTLAAAEEAEAKADVELLMSCSWLMQSIMPETVGQAAVVKKKQVDLAQQAAAGATGAVPYFEAFAVAQQQLDTVAKSLSLESKPSAWCDLALRVVDCVQSAAVQQSQAASAAKDVNATVAAAEQFAEQLQQAVAGVEAMAVLQAQRNWTDAQVAALQNMEAHYGLANNSPGVGVTRAAGAKRLAFMGYDDVYLGSASYLLCELTGMRLEPSGGGRSAEAASWDDPSQAIGFLPLRAARSAVMQLLAWDVARRTHTALVHFVFDAVTQLLADTSVLTKLADVQSRVSLLLGCLRLCQLAQDVVRARNALWPPETHTDKKGSLKKVTRGPREDRPDQPVVPDSPVQPTPTAVKEWLGAQEMLRHLEGVCCGLLAAATLPSGHPLEYSQYLNNFKTKELPLSRMPAERVAAMLFRVFDAGVPNHGKWQGVNFTCWWGSAMLLQNPPKQIKQRSSQIPVTYDRFYTRDVKQALHIPEELLTSATDNLQVGYTEAGVQNLADYLRKSLDILSRAAKGQADVPAQFLTPEPLVLILEYYGSTVAAGLPRQYNAGNNDLKAPRAYLPTTGKDLITEVPLWGLSNAKTNEQWSAKTLLTYWTDEDKSGYSHDDLVGHAAIVLLVVDDLCRLLTSTGPVLATTAQQQVVSLLAAQQAKERGQKDLDASIPTVSLSEGAQLARAAALVMRLAQLVASMLMTCEVAAAVRMTLLKARSDKLDKLMILQRKVLARMFPALQQSRLPQFNGYADSLKQLLAAPKLGDLMRLTSTFVGGMVEVTRTSERDFTGSVAGSQWKQIQAMNTSGTTKPATAAELQAPLLGERNAFDVSKDEQAKREAAQEQERMRHKAAIVLQQFYRKRAAAYKAEQQRLQDEARRRTLVDTLQELYDTHASFRNGLAAWRQRAQANIQERKFAVQQAARMRALAEEAKSSNLLASIRAHTVALDDIDNRLKNVALGGLCPLCPAPMQPPAAAAAPSPHPEAAPADSGSTSKSFAAVAAAARAAPGSQRLMAAAMRTVVSSGVMAGPRAHDESQHRTRLGIYELARKYYHDQVVPWMWWTEVLRVTAETAMQRLRDSEEENDDKTNLLMMLSRQKVNLDDLTISLQNLLRQCQANHDLTIKNLRSFNVNAATVVVPAAKKLVQELGQSELFLGAFTAAIQAPVSQPIQALQYAKALTNPEKEVSLIQDAHLPRLLAYLTRLTLVPQEAFRLLGGEWRDPTEPVPQPSTTQGADTSAADGETAVETGDAVTEPGASLGAVSGGSLLDDHEEALRLGQEALRLTPEQLREQQEQQENKEDDDEREEDNEEVDDDWEEVGPRGRKGGARGAGGGGVGPNAQANRRRMGGGGGGGGTRRGGAGRR